MTLPGEEFSEGVVQLFVIMLTALTQFQSLPTQIMVKAGLKDMNTLVDLLSVVIELRSHQHIIFSELQRKS